MIFRWNYDRFEIDEDTARRLGRVYPFFARELAKMEVWYLANPRKQKKNHYRFAVNWLNKCAGEQKESAPGIDYSRHNKELHENRVKAEKEVAPPPPEWAKMMEKLKPIGG